MRLGYKQKMALSFAIKYNGRWHTFANSAKREIMSLAKRGLVEVNEYQQFRDKTSR